ncbi:protein FAM53B [Astyanax mexicanus]|uniref:Family with sequence similarity 53 member B n=1 Tax=Astyanax mexicanus TaxID=7994 RepID=A0A8B9JGX3_ASTMX|nr:protein FAM53B [Astyanax mexicanus]
MCVAMVIIHTKTLEKKKGVDDVTSKESTLELRQPSTMSQGTALFSCGIMEAGRWPDVSRSFGVRQRPVGSSLESLWDVLPEAGAAGTISGLLRDLSLSETANATTAPPSKRQCRSLSCSDEPACRSPWRPQGSRVWTTVEKRRCHSGGSVQRGSTLSSSVFTQSGFAGMQRSSSFSLPTRSDLLELPAFGTFQRQAFTPFSAAVSETPHYLSHEQICLAEPSGGPSEASSPESTPELDRRAGQGGLSRSRSQPCVLNDKKIGVKRRRPADSHKHRPSLDLAKMTQKQNFQSLSCPGFTGDDCCQSSQTPPSVRSPAHQNDIPPTSSACDQGVEPRHSPKEASTVIDESDGGISGCVDWTANGKELEPPWAGLCGLRRDVLGGELDIEQIERN